MTTTAGRPVPVLQLSSSISDPPTRKAVRVLEQKVIELEARLVDVERRLAAGGL